MDHFSNRFSALLDGQNQRLVSTLERCKTNAETRAAMDKLAFEECRKTFISLFNAAPTAMARLASHHERSTLGLMGSGLVYGETPLEVLAAVLWAEEMELRPGGIFYECCEDLGCGTGRMVIGAALLHNFDVLVGVELLNGVFDLAAKVLFKYNAHVRVNSTRSPMTVARRQTYRASSARQGKPSQSEGDAEIQYRREDMFYSDWSDGSVIFVNLSTFEEHQVAILASQTGRLAPGSFVISVTKELKCQHLEKVFEKHVVVDQNPLTTHVYRRKERAPMAALGEGEGASSSDDDDDDDGDEEDGNDQQWTRVVLRTDDADGVSEANDEEEEGD